MNYTPDELRDLRDAIDAHLNGEPVQYWNTTYSSPKWIDTNDPDFSLRHLLYRPKPLPKMRPWSKPEDVPGPVCWVRYHGSMELLVTALGSNGIRLGGLTIVNALTTGEKPWSTFAETQAEYSTDRKTWKPCTVEVAE